MLPIILGIIMGISHYFSEDFISKIKKSHKEVLSLSAGIAITYVFLDLFPKFSYGAIEISSFLFLSLLFGFTIFHLTEKYIYQHAPKNKRLRELAIEDSTISFIYHFVIGMILVSFFNESLIRGILFFIPVFLYTTVSTLPVDITKSIAIKIIVAISTLSGVLFATFIYTNIDPLIHFALLGFIIGALFFTITRHSIPIGKEGKPLFFIIGVIIYSILLYTL